MLPLTCWQLCARELPDSLADCAHERSFTLPGAKALEDFSELLGFAPDTVQEHDVPLQSAPVTLPAMFPSGLEGPVSLKKEIDFGSFRGERAVLTIDHIIGRGRILLDEDTLCSFDSARFGSDTLEAAHHLSSQPCVLAVDLTDALKLGRKQALIIEFDDSRPAGVTGPVFLRITGRAQISTLSLMPDARRQTISLSAQITAHQSGRYVLRTQAFASDGSADMARETTLILHAAETKPVQFSFALPGGFETGKAPSVKVQLFARRENAGSPGLLCDSVTLMCGGDTRTPESYLPLDRAAAFDHPAKTAETLLKLHIPAVSLDIPAPDIFYRALCRAGVAIRQYMPANHPLRHSIGRFSCVSLCDMPAEETSLSLEASAWQLCSMVCAPRALDEALSSRELLKEASGLPLDPKDEGVCEILAWLRVLCVRLRAEAARQRRYRGALCFPGEWTNPDTENALRTAFLPLHLSALPLCGAWWTCTRFSASLEAFIPEDTYKDGKPLSALAILEDGDGRELARFEASCPARGGYLGVIECMLPDQSCVLELTTRLIRGDEVLEESSIPVYVGERGQLEAAFT